MRERVAGCALLPLLAPRIPGLLIERPCRHSRDTAPILARDPKRTEDVDTTGPDHRADAIRNVCLRQELAEEVKLVRTYW